jgi:hypothetical protein
MNQHVVAHLVNGCAQQGPLLRWLDSLETVERSVV